MCPESRFRRFSRAWPGMRISARSSVPSITRRPPMRRRNSDVGMPGVPRSLCVRWLIDDGNSWVETIRPDMKLLGTAGPTFDRAYKLPTGGLSRRGLLESTLVVAMGEFGRTPKINPDGGRDHWPHCFSIVLAGCGIRGGQVYGSSDRIGAEPRDNPVTPAMIAATVRKAMGTRRRMTARCSLTGLFS